MPERRERLHLEWGLRPARGRFPGANAPCCQIQLRAGLHSFAMPPRFLLTRCREPTRSRVGKVYAHLPGVRRRDRKSTRLNSSHGYISYAVFCLKKKKKDSNKLSAPDSTIT